MPYAVKQERDGWDPTGRRTLTAYGHEYHVVTKNEADGHIRFFPRNIDDTPLETEDDDDVAGYLCPVPADDPDFSFDGDLNGYPESWLEWRNGIERLRSYRKKRAPISYVVTPDGRHGAGGREFWPHFHDLAPGGKIMPVVTPIVDPFPTSGTTASRRGKLLSEFSQNGFSSQFNQRFQVVASRPDAVRRPFEFPP